ncbi:GNAT family N-acetyltransferase/peptidase C39 family protein [Paraglaciecola aquimarina]|uniref:GNAT family N-acetyltransferase/peptidase C39 family protein n=1 Tax=Paraglaciecola algarum TaxID=3050085 RepID=A0ABS9D840_9ALTE|nr:GNAT family N-acetyltransferase/peptidase C39 family protein [Paraglaciecola sp. G1-23]MCF2949128.1 GNAT family N-acetyltransferase/peptidase C39 family protein [Paraglaciecola sp. G1-23]
MDTHEKINCQLVSSDHSDCKESGLKQDDFKQEHSRHIKPQPASSAQAKFVTRAAGLSDLAALVDIEQNCFATDRLSKRSFRHWLQSPQCIFIVIEQATQIVGYGLVIMRSGTRLARLYSLAILSDVRGQGVGKLLLIELEKLSVEAGKLFLRLEVEKTNKRAISLYQAMGYKVFGDYKNYYENNNDALRMQKSIRHYSNFNRLPTYPWYEQTTDFTCGPAALMMAMKSISADMSMDQQTELDLWREATTIFMMSGHGGCHPIGLALAAEKRGFNAKVLINQTLPLFTAGVRSEHKKQTVELVEAQFASRAATKGIQVETAEFDLDLLQSALESGGRVLSLISTYQMDGYKVPHWVTITAMDDDCLYFHDPSVPDGHVMGFDCQHIPLAKEDFIRLSSYGKNKLRTAIILN